MLIQLVALFLDSEDSPPLSSLQVLIWATLHVTAAFIATVLLDT